MAQDIRLDFSAATAAITITINSVADAGTATATAIDLGAQAPHEIGIHLVLDGNSASNTGYFESYIMWSEDNTAFTDANNAHFYRATLMNGTTAVDDHFVVPVLARYFKLYIVNNSGDSMLSSGNSAEYWAIAVDQA
jgi:hypothetical protein